MADAYDYLTIMTIITASSLATLHQALQTHMHSVHELTSKISIVNVDIWHRVAVWSFGCAFVSRNSSCVSAKPDFLLGSGGFGPQ